MSDKRNKIKLYWVEEQEIFQKLFLAIFDAHSPFEVVKTGKFGDIIALNHVLKSIAVDVLLVGFNNLAHEFLRQLAEIRKTYPGLGIVILPSIVKYEDVPVLKTFVISTRSACGIILKQSLTETGQLFSTLTMVKSGQVVIDPKLAGLISAEKEKSNLSRGLTTREMEILKLISRGYTNIAISECLCIDVKTVRHHINNLYSKLKASTEFDNRHPRVSATNIYLRLSGQLTFDDQNSQT